MGGGGGSRGEREGKRGRRGAQERGKWSSRRLAGYTKALWLTRVHQDESDGEAGVPSSGRKGQDRPKGLSHDEDGPAWVRL